MSAYLTGFTAKNGLFSARIVLTFHREPVL